MGVTHDPLDRQYAPGWVPETDDRIRGTFISKDERQGNYGAYPIYTMQLDEGCTANTVDGPTTREVAVHAQRDGLRVRLENAQLKPGDRFGVRYLGRRAARLRATVTWS